MWKNQLKNKLFSLKEPVNKLINDFTTDDHHQKDDGSPVTKIDLFISSEMEMFFSRALSSYKYFCEENHSHLKFPAIIIDPIDGTRGILDGTLESSISIAVMEDSSISEDFFGIVYNPFNGYYIDSEMLKDKSPLVHSARLLKGMVSRTEYNSGLYQSFGGDEIFVLPMGSIAYKLGLLAGGMIDFVITKKPKHIWDIAAGSILCKQQGIYLFNHSGEKVNNLVELHDETLIWSNEANIGKILKELKA